MKIARGWPLRRRAWSVLVIAFALLSVAGSAGCAARNPITIERSNARTPLEEKAYNILLVSERIILAVEASNDAGTLPEYMKPAFNRLIDVHNETMDMSASYVALLDAGTEEEGFAALTELILDLDRLILQLFIGGSP